jgi:peroxiredoxin Q/BCP
MAKEPNRAAAHRGPTLAAGTVPRAFGRRMVMRRKFALSFPRHAAGILSLDLCPRRRSIGAPHGGVRRIKTAVGRCPLFALNRRNPLRPPGANGIADPSTDPLADIDWLKTTKGRHMAGKLARKAAPELTEGDKAPAFTLLRDGGDRVALKDFKGRNLVLYFYPKADTPGCTTESIAFSTLRAAFAKAGTDILGVSADSVAKQDKFKAKHKLTIPLGSDESKEMLEAYGAWGEKSMYGLKFVGVIRKTFLIGADGRIVKIWPKVRVKGHAEEVLEAAKTI